MKSTTLSIIALITLFFTACTEPQTPQQVTEAFANAYENSDWETAKQNATVRGVDQLESAEESLLSMFDNLTILGTNVNEKKVRVIENIDCPESAENNCECTVTFKNKEKVAYKLIREGDNWKVDFELSKTEQIFNDGIDFVQENLKGEIEAVGDMVDGVIDQGVEMIADSVKSAVGL